MGVNRNYEFRTKPVPYNLNLGTDHFRYSEYIKVQKSHLKNFRIIPGNHSTKDTIELIKSRFFQYKTLINTAETLLSLDGKSEEEIETKKKKLLESIARLHEREASKYIRTMLKPSNLIEGTTLLSEIDYERANPVIDEYHNCVRECRETIESLEEQKRRNR